jgi:uncharacterized membrane protein YeaQ/YmgE (transglycosylase-associated protein family)
MCVARSKFGDSRRKEGMIYTLILILLGLVISLIFKATMARHSGSTMMTILFGIIGALVSGFLASAFFGPGSGGNFLFAFIGTIILLALSGIMARQKVPAAVNEIYSRGAQQLPTNNFQTSAQHEFQVKICPSCKRAYSDISLNFCLDDGVPLSNVVSVQSSHDPEETVFSSKGSLR